MQHAIAVQHATIPAPPAMPRPPRLLDRLRNALRAHGCTLDTEQAYVGWAERYVWYHGQRHPAGLSETDVGRFLRHLARDRGAPPEARSQAFAALLFLYREVLGVELDWRHVTSRARRQSQSPSARHSGRNHVQ
jgi:hypothetical protein